MCDRKKKRVNDSKLGKSLLWTRRTQSCWGSPKKNTENCSIRGLVCWNIYQPAPSSAAAGYSWMCSPGTSRLSCLYAGPQSLLRKPRAERNKMCMTDTGDTSRWTRSWIDNRRASLEPTSWIISTSLLLNWPYHDAPLPTTFPQCLPPVTNSDNQLSCSVTWPLCPADIPITGCCFSQAVFSYLPSWATLAHQFQGHR